MGFEMDRSLYGPVTIPASSQVGEHCVIGCPKEARLFKVQAGEEIGRGAPVIIGERCLLFHHVTVYEGVQLGDDCVVEDRVRVGYGSHIGAGSRLMYGAYVCDRVQIGVEARIAGFICDGTTIGERSTVMGQLVHEYTRPHEGWWQVDEPSPVIEHDVVIGYGATVVGGVRIGPYSYVAAGAVVTTDVPSGRVVVGINVQTPITDWTGRRLSDALRSWVVTSRSET